MIRLLAFLLVAFGSVGVSHAQDSVGWPLPRNDIPGIPSSAPTSYDCAKKACIYLVNLSNHRVTQFRYATVMDKSGSPKWSGNAFPSNFDFYAKRWTMWYPPKEAGCSLALKVVMTIDGKDHEESGSFDICANPTLLFYIHDPLDKGQLGTVTVDPPAPAKP